MPAEPYKCRRSAHRIAGSKRGCAGLEQQLSFLKQSRQAYVESDDTHKDAQEVVWLGCFMNSVSAEHGD